MEHPIVFISYSHDDELHKEWVLKLATNLRYHGVDVILDQWDLKIGSDLRFFMEQGLSKARLVLCICSENYVKKVNAGQGGVGYEGMIMTQQLLNDVKSEHIIAIIRNNNSSQKVPLAFGSKLYIDFSDDDQYIVGYQKLLERIYGQDSKKKPSLGKNPFSKEIANKIDNKTRTETVKYHSPAMKGNVVFRFDNNDGVYTLGTGEYAFETKWSRSGNGSIYAYGSIGYKDGETEFPKIDELYKFDFSSHARTIYTGQIVIFKNTNGYFVAIKVGKVKSRNHGNSYDEMEFEYYIYS